MTKEILDVPEVADRDRGDIVYLSGVIASELHIIEASALRLVAAFSSDAAEEEHVVPLLDWRLKGHNMIAPDQDLSIQRLVALDNMAFLVNDLCQDLAQNIEKLKRMGIPPSMEVRRVVEWMGQTAESATQAMQSAQKILKSMPIGDEGENIEV